MESSGTRESCVTCEGRLIYDNEVRAAKWDYQVMKWGQQRVSVTLEGKYVGHLIRAIKVINYSRHLILNKRIIFIILIFYNYK